MNLDSLNVYQRAMELGESVWKIVHEWNYFDQQTIGRQLVRAADSVAANLSEGYGRYHYKEARNFVYYARGSLFETKTWLIKATNRNLIKDDQSRELLGSIEVLLKMINGYNRSIGSVEEPKISYSGDDHHPFDSFPDA